MALGCIGAYATAYCSLGVHVLRLDICANACYDSSGVMDSHRGCKSHIQAYISGSSEIALVHHLCRCDWCCCSEVHGRSFPGGLLIPQALQSARQLLGANVTLSMQRINTAADCLLMLRLISRPLLTFSLAAVQGKLYPRDEDEKQRALAAGYDLEKVLLWSRTHRHVMSSPGYNLGILHNPGLAAGNGCSWQAMIRCSFITRTNRINEHR